MGHMKFGNLAFVRNVIYVRISPFETQIFPHFIKTTWNGFKRDFSKNFPYAAPPAVLGYLLYTWGNEENKRLSRKNPADYVNDV